MKQKDVAIIIVIAALSGVISFFISNKIFVTPENRQQNVEIVDPISTEFKEPDSRYFNKDSINPTRSKTVQDKTNENPFNGTGQ